jgi:cytochrome c oxidase subunit II
VSRQRMWRVLPVFALLALALSGCSNSKVEMNVLDPHGSAGEKQLDLINWSFILMLAVFAVVTTIYIYVLIRYRKRKGIDRMPEQVHGNTVLEIVWTVIPIILLAILAVPTVSTTFDLSEKPKTKDAIRVVVTGHQYWWEFEYPDLGIKTAQELHIPVGRKVDLEIHGKDVLHSFWVPSLQGKTDVVPGRVNHMTLDADKPGVYQGKCAELCGAGHALMDFKVIASNDADFNKWVAEMKAPPAPVTTASEKKGEQLFQQNCMGCHAGINPNVQGPDLNKFGTRTTIAGVLPHDEQHLKQWLHNPQAVKPGALMPKINYLQPDEIQALTDYLMSRK